MYYTIKNDDILIANNKQALTRFYDNVLPLPEDYEVGKYIVENNQLVINPNYEHEQEAKEKERVANLTMTSLDFITFLETLGLTLEAITAWLELPENLRIKTQLTYCQNVYCGVVTQLLPITLGDITITEDLVVNAFKAKYGEV